MTLPSYDDLYREFFGSSVGFAVKVEITGPDGRKQIAEFTNAAVVLDTVDDPAYERPIAQLRLTTINTIKRRTN